MYRRSRIAERRLGVSERRTAAVEVQLSAGSGTGVATGRSAARGLGRKTSARSPALHSIAFAASPSWRKSSWKRSLLRRTSKRRCGPSCLGEETSSSPTSTGLRLEAACRRTGRRHGGSVSDVHDRSREGGTTADRALREAGLNWIGDVRAMFRKQNGKGREAPRLRRRTYRTRYRANDVRAQRARRRPYDAETDTPGSEIPAARRRSRVRL